MKTISFLVWSIVILSLFGCAPTSQTAEAPPIQTGIDSESWALVPAGQFYVGQHAHAVAMDYDYEIMVTDVTNAQFAHFLAEALESGAVELEGLNLVGHYPGDVFHGGRHEEEIPAGDYLLAFLDDPNTRILAADDGYTAAVPYENHPAAMMTWFGAKAYCEYYGWRLPTEEEWEKAARGTDTRPFPWGDVLAPPMPTTTPATISLKNWLVRATPPRSASSTAKPMMALPPKIPPAPMGFTIWPAMSGSGPPMYTKPSITAICAVAARKITLIIYVSGRATAPGLNTTAPM